MQLLTLGLCLFYTTSSAHASLSRNITIDDHYGDAVTGVSPVYCSDTDSRWNFGPACSSCALKPDADKLFMGTWHDCTAKSSDHATQNVTLTFTGIVAYSRHVELCH